MKKILQGLLAGAMVLGGCSGGKFLPIHPPIGTYKCCYDELYDSDLRCVDQTEWQLEKAVDSTYPIIIQVSDLKGRIVAGGQGSGTLFRDGYVLTATHLVHEIPGYNSDLFLRHNDMNLELEVVVKERFENIDYAWLKLKNPDIKLPHSPFEFGDCDTLKPGDFIYIIGNKKSEGISVVDSTVSRTKDAKRLTESNADAEHYFTSSSFVWYGDSGGGVYAIHDGKFEYVGIVSHGDPLSRSNEFVRINNVLEDSLEKLLLSSNLGISEHPELVQLILDLSKN